MIVLDVMGLVAIGIVQLHPIAQVVATASLVFAVLTNLTMVWATARPERYTERVLGLYFMCAACVNSVILLCVGLFSMLFALLPLVQFSISLGYSPRSARTHLVVVGGLVASLQTLVVLKWLPDIGLMRNPNVPAVALLFMIAFGAILLLVGHRQGLQMRVRLQTAVEERKSAIRAAAQREALLAEVQHDLQQAVAAGGYGRLTEQIIDDYVLGPLLGRGGMGEVYEAHHQLSGRSAALKTLRPDAFRDPEFLRRFIREGRILQGLRSPHIVAVYDVAGGDAPLPYIAMERLEGEDLRAVLAREGALAGERVVQLVEQLARGITDANEAGIVHRDLKPSNIHRTIRGHQWIWKILDFGVARRIASSVTMTGQGVIGTPQYMAPEQARGDAVDTRADVYSLGAIAYRALTGHQPFSGKDALSVLHSVMVERAPPVHEFVDVPAAVDRVFRRVLAKSPDNRYSSAMQFANAFAEAMNPPPQRATADVSEHAAG